MPSMLLIRLPLLCALALALATTLTSAQTIYDVTKYGAVGDGKTDCTAAVVEVAAMLMQDESNGGSGMIFFPAGTYLLSSTPPSNLPAYITFGSNSAQVTYYYITGEMPSGGSTYDNPLATIVWHSDLAEFVNYQGGLPGTPSQSTQWLVIANLTVTTPANVVGWRSMIEWNGPNVAQVVNVNYIGNSISPQMLLFNSLGAGNINFYGVTATGINLFFETFVTGSTNDIFLWNVTVSSSAMMNQRTSSSSPAGITLQGGFSSVTIQSCSFDATNLFIQSSSGQPTVSITSSTWTDSDAAITIADSSSVDIYYNTFNVGNFVGQSFNGAAVILVGLGLPTNSNEAPIVTISDSQFNGASSDSSQYTGIIQNIGWLTVSNNEFHNLATGFNYSGNTPATASHPFSLINNLFNGMSTTPAIGTGYRIVVSGNECQSSGSMAVVCEGECSIGDNSPSCNA